MFGAQKTQIMKFYLLVFFSFFMQMTMHAQCRGGDPSANLSVWDYGISIEANFNAAHREEETDQGLTANCLGDMTEIPGGWTNATLDEIALYIHNSERGARGVASLYGVEDHLDAVAQAHSAWQISTEVFAHGGDPTLGSNSSYAVCGSEDDQCGTGIPGSSPFDRMNQNAPLSGNWQSESENIAVSVTSGSSISSLMTLVTGMYRFMYNDAGSAWGHRHNMLNTYTDDWGDAGNEGFIGVGVAQGGPYKSCAFGCNSWNLAAIATIDYYDPNSTATGYTFSATLPVELIAFNAQIKNGKTVLHWATASQENSEFFAVERSKDGIRFEEIGYVDVTGDTHLRTDYSFVDDAPFDGISYYQLRVVDFDAREAQSKIVSVTLFSESKISFYPNPVQEVLYVDGSQNMEGAVFFLYDLTGHLLMTKAIASPTMDMTAIKAGAYIYVVKDASGMRIKKGSLLKN